MADQNPDLLKQADELGIKTDKRWGDERLQQEIDKALEGVPQADLQPAPKDEPFGGQGDHDGDGKPGGAAPALKQMRVNRDFWDENGDRHRKGTIVEVSADDAINGAETGALSRVK